MSVACSVPTQPFACVHLRFIFSESTFIGMRSLSMLWRKPSSRELVASFVPCYTGWAMWSDQPALACAGMGCNNHGGMQTSAGHA